MSVILITRRKDIYRKNLELSHDSVLVIDGDSVAVTCVIMIEWVGTRGVDCESEILQKSPSQAE